MTIIEPSVEIIREKDPYKKVEICARTCYKSEDKITADSAKRMFDSLVKNCHTAMLEHYYVVFQLHLFSLFNELQKCKFVNCTAHKGRFLVSCNLRTLYEYGEDANIKCLYDAFINKNSQYVYQIDFESLEDKTDEEILNHRYTTMRFITDRAVTHELVRHRLFSYAQESTRYVNYASDSHGSGDIKFIKPTDWDNWDEKSQKSVMDAFKKAEREYNRLISYGRTPQEARTVLPNGLKTEIVVTGNDKEWKHFFNLRSKGTTGKPHPDMKKVADMALELYEKEYDVKI